MGNRDDDLDDLERDLREPLFEPRTKPIGPGMECWLDQTRICGPTCMAYNTDDTDELTGKAIDGPDRCLVLLSTSAQGAAAILAVTAGVATLRRAQQQVMNDQAAADDAERNSRGGIPPVPSVSTPKAGS